MPSEQGDKNTQISDSDKKLNEIGDVLRDAISRFDSVVSRMDSMEERFAEKDKARKDAEVIEPGAPREATADARKDAEEEERRADKARKEAEDEERRADKARKDSEEEEGRRADAADEERREADARKDADRERQFDSLHSEVASLKALLAPRARSDDDRQRFATIQEEAEPAYQAFSDRAAAPMDGETPLDYKRRLVGKLQKHSTRWEGQRLSSVSDEGILNNIASDVYADAMSAARRGVAVLPGELREKVSRSMAGHTRVEFEGDASSWMDGFAGHTLRATGKFIVPA